MLVQRTPQLTALLRSMAREWAFQNRLQHGYLPQTIEDAATFEPHGWVDGAMLAAYSLGTQPANARAFQDYVELRNIVDDGTDGLTHAQALEQAAVQVKALHDSVNAAANLPLLQRTARDYEELRSVIDGGSESMTHADAMEWVKQAAQQFEQPVDANAGFVNWQQGATVRPLLRGEVSPQCAASTTVLAAGLRKVIEAAKDANVPQGLIVALLHAEAQRETGIMLE